jgi:hypothetical protein
MASNLKYKKGIVPVEFYCKLLLKEKNSCNRSSRKLKGELIILSKMSNLLVKLYYFNS